MKNEKQPVMEQTEIQESAALDGALLPTRKHIVWIQANIFTSPMYFNMY